MTNTTATPATKQQLDALIDLCLDGGHTEAAGLLKLGSDTLSQIVRDFDAKQAAAKEEAGFDEEHKESGCCCYEHIGDNPLCPIHGDEFTPADEQERQELYTLGMGA